MDLVLNTYGTTLSKDDNSFIVLHQGGRQRIPTEGLKSITISRGAQISSDAAILAIEKEIEVIFVDQAGNPIGRIWSSKYGSVSTIRKGQLEFCLSKDAIAWICKIVQQKLENQQALLLSMQPPDHKTEEQVKSSINKLEDYRTKIGTIEGEVVPEIAASLRGWEGAATKIYFESVNWFLPESLKFNLRSQHPAMDLVNCLLNYGYGILYGKIEGALIKAGIDPYVGIFHRDDYNRPVLVFDVIEPFRVWVDYVVISLAVQQVINEDCYQVKDDGSYWLENLGKRILIQSMNDYFDEVINMKGIERSRCYQIQLFAQNLAQIFKNFAYNSRI